MEIKLLKRMGSVLLISLLVYSCTSSSNGSKAIDNAKIGVTKYNDCIKACKAQEAQFTAEYNSCMAHCESTYKQDSVTCSHIIPNPHNPNQLITCIADARNARNACEMACMKAYQDHMAQVSKCFQDCLDTFNTEFKEALGQ